MAGKKITDKDYLFISAMVRACETKMLDSEHMERMLQAPDFDSAAAILTECGFEDMSGYDFNQTEAALNRHRGEIFEDLAHLAPQPELVDIFRMRYDYHNAKVLIKSEAANLDGKRLLSSAGSVEPEELTAGYLSGEYGGVPITLADAMREAKDVIARTGNPQSADILLDKAYYENFSATAKKLGSRFLEEYCSLQADAVNLNACVRIKKMGKDAEFLKSALVAGGSIGAEHLAAAVGGGESLVSVFASSPLSDAAAAGEQALEGGSLTEFEKLTDAVLSEYLSSADLVSFGEAPLVAYIQKVENEITAARMILTGKRSGISSDIIRERLRDANA